MGGTEKTKNNNKNSENPDLRLNGSQINLTCRPLVRENRTNIRLPVYKRPMSAIPELSAYKNCETSQSKVAAWMRPQSADNAITNKQRLKLATRFPISDNNDSNINISSNSVTDLRPKKSKRLNLPSTKLLESLLSEPVIRSWAHPQFESSSETQEEISEEIESIKSNDVSDSEMSLGTKIQILAQKSQTTSMELLPGIKHKPPLPTNTKRNTDFNLTKEKHNYLDMMNNKIYSETADFNDESLIFDNEYITKSTKLENSVSMSSEGDKNKQNSTVDKFSFSEINERGLTDFESDKNTKITDTIGLSFQGWINEHNNLPSTNCEAEKQSDVYLDNLRKQQEEFAKCLNDVNNPKVDDWGLDCLIEDESECLVETNNSLLENKLIIVEENDPIIEKNEVPIKSEDNTTQKLMEDLNITCFSLEEYDEKLKRDIEFLSLDIDIRNTDKIDVESSFMSLNNDVLKLNSEKNDKEQIKLQTEVKNTKKNTGRKEKRTNKIASPKLSEDNFHKLTNPKLKRSMSPVIKTNEEIESWMSLNNNFDTEAAAGTNCNNDISRNVDLHGDVDEKPERDLSGKQKSVKIDVLQNVISTIPSTYDDIVSILKVLEQEDKSSAQNKSEFSLRVENKSKVVDVNKNIRSNSCGAVSNYEELISFLDEVDRNCTQSLNTSNFKSLKNNTESVIGPGKIPKLEELISLGSMDLAHQVLGMHLQLEEKTSSIKLLQDTLAEQRTINQKTVKQMELENKKKLKSQKDEYESVIKRHQKFIDQLIADKKTLSEQCEVMVREMRNLEERHKTAMKTCEHRHAVELQRLRDMHVAGEKLRRERWIDNKTQKIKEMTVKSIEPELENIEKRHQQELIELRSLHKHELEELELRAARKSQQQCEALREQLSREKEQAIANERELMRRRMENLSEAEEKNYQEQRRKLMTEIAREKQRVEEEFETRLADCVARETAAVKERDRAVELARVEFEDRFDALSRRHNSEIKTYKETLELEKESWQVNYRKQQALELTQKETEMRDQCRRERDREIELVIDRLESEARETKKQVELSAENKVKRLTEKYQMEIKQMEASEEMAMKKYNEMKNKLVDTEDIVIELRSAVKRLEMQYRQTQEMCDKLMTERNSMKEIVREELRGEVVALQKEIESLKANRDKEIHQVHTRVKVAIARKDEALSTLNKDHVALQERCAHLENLLKQQRRDYLLK